MTVFEAGGETIVVDTGLASRRDEHLGVDLVLPDFGYLRDRHIRAVLLTHGHEDHVGGLPYVLRELDVGEVWATRLTLGLVKSKLDEHGLLRAAELREVEPGGEPLELGPFRAEFVRMAHSIPDAVAIALDTPGGLIVHTGDYKLDHTPIDGLKTDVGGPAELEELAPHEVLILCTGSQGEPLSALTRIAYNDHPAVRVERGDTVIISAKPVPGNELRVHDSINRLAQSGAEVLHQEIAPVHVSGHACAAELRTILSLLRPRAVMPVHGEFRMLSAHAQLAREAGVPANAIVLAENGSVVELSADGVGIVG